MLLPLSRLAVVAVLYLSVVVTNAIPVAQDHGAALVEHGEGGAPHNETIVARRPPPARRPSPGRPRPTVIAHPVPPRPRPAPTKKPTVIRLPPKPTAVPPHPVPPPHAPAPRPTKVPPAPPKPAPKPTHIPPGGPAPPNRPPPPFPPHAPPKPTRAPIGHPAPQPRPPTPKPPVRPPPSKSPIKLPPGKVPAPTKPSQCQLPPRVPGKSPRAFIEWLFKRDSAEFIGWHGTNSATAALWMAHGSIVEPRGGRSGADHELGEGLYVTDAIETARGFAYNNAAVNKGTTPMLCGIYVRSQNNWRSSVNKVWLPNAVIRDSSNPALHVTYERERVAWIARVIPHSTGSDVARFAPLDKNRHGSPGQVVIPSALTSRMYAVCVDAGSRELPVGSNPHINYQTQRHPWNVRDQPCV